MKSFILILFLFYTSLAFGWYPHKHSHEIRLIARTIENPLKSGLSGWDVNGQLLQKKITEKSQIGAMFELGSKDKESKLGAHYTYSLNRYVDLAVSGDVSQLQNFGGSFWLNLNLQYKDFDFKPFVNVDHKTIAETGFVLYKSFGGVLFNVGFAYSPSLSIKDKVQLASEKTQDARFTVIFGTSLDSFPGFKED